MTTIFLELISLFLLLLFNLTLFDAFTIDQILITGVILGAGWFFIKIFIEYNERRLNILNPELWFHLGFLIFMIGGMYSEFIAKRDYVASKDTIIWTINLVFGCRFIFNLGFHISNTNQRTQTSKKYISEQIILLLQKRTIHVIILFTFLSLFSTLLSATVNPIYQNIISFFQYASIPAAILAFCIIFFNSKKMKFSNILLLSIILVNLLLTTSRTPVSYFFVSIFIIIIWYNLYYKEKKFRVSQFNFILLSISFIVLLFYIGNLYKSIALLTQKGFSLESAFYEYATVSDPNVRLYSHTLDFEFADAYTNLVAIKELYYDEDILYYGSTIVATVSNFIPRAIWPTKPESFAAELAFKLYPHYARYGLSLSTSLIGEMLVNFSLFGTLIFFFLFGLLLFKVYKMYMMKALDISFILNYSLILFMILMESRGDLTTINIRGLGFIFFMYFATKYIFNPKKKNVA